MKASQTFLVSSFAVLAFAGCTVGPSAVIHPEIPTTPEQAKPVSKDPLDAASHKLIMAAQSRIAQLPTDGVFGISRVPTFHGTRALIDETVGGEGYAAYKQLAENHMVLLVSYGQFGENGVAKRVRYIPIDQINPSGREPDRLGVEKFPNLAPASASKLWASKDDTLIVRLPENPKVVVELQKIYSDNPKCQNCHSEIASGKPIGVIAVGRVPLGLAVPPPANANGG
ncbi:MAG: hypothetical protein JNM28_13050 [Armatimonadetes bacterium]|nr:hypothetical protein [Armatimonadota bacterium]MBS1711528.1 hypothetical protein [Armatimonadota bacterium]MBX3107547.1 hypothetical protein [Fimbriimonadaceae bacterium]